MRQNGQFTKFTRHSLHEKKCLQGSIKLSQGFKEQTEHNMVLFKLEEFMLLVIPPP